MWEFPQIRGTSLGVPIIRTIVFWGLHWGPPILGNYHVAFSFPFDSPLAPRKWPAYTKEKRLESVRKKSSPRLRMQGFLWKRVEFGVGPWQDAVHTYEPLSKLH